MTQGIGYALLAATLGLSLWSRQGRQLATLDDCRAPGFELAAGEVNFTDVEADEGYYTVGGVTFVVPRQGAAAMRLRDLRGRRGALVFVPEAAK